MTAQTDLLTVIHQVDPMYVFVSAPESFLLKRRRDVMAKRIQHPGMYELRGVITFVDGSTYPHEGALDFADVGLRTETGSRQARVTFPNPDRILLPGQFVKVRFKGTMKSGVILVPQRAVQQGAKGPIVFVVGEGDKVEMREVQATGWHDNQWLARKDCVRGDRVMLSGFHKCSRAPVHRSPLRRRREWPSRSTGFPAGENGLPRTRRRPNDSSFFIDRPIFASVLSIVTSS